MVNVAPDEDRAQLESELEEVEHQLAWAMQALKEGDLTWNDYVEEIGPLRDRCEALEADLLADGFQDRAADVYSL